ncbi:LOW QUALITY PROTEIN: hypothetical protein PHMEG_00023177 [Phytophthora megakarya]|uniref:Uncharacterized protein n=1 Tax=Phytophthora megakarya TaxID=4795 RepID=A0A225VJ09_9STRA|nr:LOW QUALITY PROTEIN: hypothetical protein PHMEG_00023177 [Phytophthora megakarya]
MTDDEREILNMILSRQIEVTNPLGFLVFTPGQVALFMELLQKSGSNRRTAAPNPATQIRNHTNGSGSRIENCKDFSAVLAADDPSVSTAAYTPVHRPDEDSDEESKDGGSARDHPRGSLLDLTHELETEPSKSGAKRKRSLKSPKEARKQILPHVPTEIQEYPSEWIFESNGPCRPDSDLLLGDVDVAREMLKLFPVIWSHLRLDVRALILYGINYEGTLEWLGEDRPVHGCFHQGLLLEMILRMMFWNELDGTPWTK